MNRVRINVLFFGVLKDFFEAERDVVELPDGATVADLLDALLLEDASEPAVWKSLAVSVNQEYEALDCELFDGDEVGLLPPVSGGADVD
jgi:molybdopterin converting factor small subunit